MKAWAALCQPKTMRRLHAALTIFWFVAAFPIMWFWSENLKFLVFVSVYAVVAGHWSSWQSTRVEERQEAAEGS